MKRVIFVLFIYSFCISFAFAEIPDDCNPIPVSYWEFNGDVTDSVGGNDGVGTGVTYLSGKVEQAASLGFSDNIDISNNPTLNPISSLSVEFWFSPSDVYSMETFILGKQGYEFSLDNQNKIRADIGGQSLESTTTIGASGFYFVVLTWDGSTVRLYINGNQEGPDISINSNYGTNNLVIGSALFEGWIDELAIYNVALTIPQILDHYDKGLRGEDYCFVSSGETSGIRRDFSLAGCDVPGLSTKLAVGACFDGEPYAGEYYCTLEKELLDTYNDGGACFLEVNDGDSDTTFCCPANFICEGTQGNQVCNKRVEICSGYINRGDCEDNSCYWIDSECLDPNDPSLSCSIYTEEDSCEEDIWNFGQNGAGTEVCGTFTPEGMVIPQDSCHCAWVGNVGEEECVLSYSSIYEFYEPGEDDGLFICNKRFDTGACIDGEQEVNQTIISIEDFVLPLPTSAQLNASQCYNDSTIRNCGQPIVSVPFFGFWNLIVACFLISLFYLFFRESL